MPGTTRNQTNRSSVSVHDVTGVLRLTSVFSLQNHPNPVDGPCPHHRLHNQHRVLQGARLPRKHIRVLRVPSHRGFLPLTMSALTPGSQYASAGFLPSGAEAVDTSDTLPRRPYRAEECLKHGRPEVVQRKALKASSFETCS